MPELPETETLARDLDRVVRGLTIHDVRVTRSDVLRGTKPSALRRRLKGSRIQRVWRRAKSVVFDLSEGNRLVVQPRFTGGLLVRNTGQDLADPYTVLSFDLGSSVLDYRDVRRLGTVTLLNEADFARFNGRLGIEPLDADFTSDRLSGFLRTSKQAVKKLIMDQHRIAGVGNIYANEALWLARLDPSRAGRNVGGDAVAKLRDAVVKVLEAAVAARGTTFRDFRDAFGERGSYSGSLAVYGRPGAPCPRCATRLVLTRAIDGRATVFCFRCQS